MYLVYLKYWTLNLIPLGVYPKVLFHPMFSIKGEKCCPQIAGKAAVSSHCLKICNVCGFKAQNQIALAIDSMHIGVSQ